MQALPARVPGNHNRPADLKFSGLKFEGFGYFVGFGIPCFPGL